MKNTVLRIMNTNKSSSNRARRSSRACLHYRNDIHRYHTPNNLTLIKLTPQL